MPPSFTHPYLRSGKSIFHCSFTNLSNIPHSQPLFLIDSEGITLLGFSRPFTFGRGKAPRPSRLLTLLALRPVCQFFSYTPRPSHLASESQRHCATPTQVPPIPRVAFPPIVEFAALLLLIFFFSGRVSEGYTWPDLALPASSGIDSGKPWLS